VITSLADLLAEFVERERAVLATVPVDHGPTIGNMYEGLSAEVAAAAVQPLDLGLRVVEGFAVDRDGNRSGQLDNMVVCGEGERIPHTDTYLWPVDDVIAVLEIKKTLYGAELADAYKHLASVKYLHEEALGRHNAAEVSGPAKTAYAQITRTVAPDAERWNRMPPHDRHFFNAVAAEHRGPLRVIIGYDGFTTEAGFRNSLVKLIGANTGTGGFGVTGFPNLIVAGGYSIVKAVGMPWSAPITDGWWNFAFSSPTNPLQLLLEILWTRLDHLYGLGNVWGEDLQLETAHAFLSGKTAVHDGKVGWEMTFVQATPAMLAAAGPPAPWSPELLSAEEYVAFMRLMNGEVVSFEDPTLIEYLAERGIDPADLQAGMLETNLVALDGVELRVIVERLQVVSLPDGRRVAAENNTGRLDRWLAADAASQE
jgi:hypothetical protein